MTVARCKACGGHTDDPALITGSCRMCLQVAADTHRGGWDPKGYDTGAVLIPGVNLVRNSHDRPEPVTPCPAP